MHSSAQLFEIVILLCAAVLIVASFRVIKLSPVLGYLVAGMVIGPFGLKLIQNVEATAGLAEFGVIFLLFLIGLELSIERLRGMRTHVFGFGGAQFLITAGVFAAFFIGFGGNEKAAVIIGGGLALSSTAVVLQVISEQGERSSQIGRVSLAVLLLQDLAVIPLLVLTQLMNAHQDQSLLSSLADAMLRAVIALGLIFIIGTRVLRPFYRFIASLENTELLSATTLFVVLGVALLTDMAGLSPAMGAFMAGLLVAETEFRPQVEADILPFKGLFLGLFFMTVGMSLDLNMLLDRFFSIISLSIALMGSKALIIMALCRVFGFGLSTAIHIGLLLSQGGEFAFVLFALAGEVGVIDSTVSQVLLVTVTMSMALTPLAAEIGQKIAQMLEKHAISRPEAMVDEMLDLSQHVIISGFGRVGHTVARLLEAETISYVAIDIDSFLVAKERKGGLPVYYGDTTRVHVLNALGIARARAFIITHSDTRVALQTIQTVRELNPEIPIIVRAKNLEQVLRLEKAGANLAVAEMFETSLQLGGALLKALSVNEYEISRIIDMFRAEDYMLTRSAEKESGGSI